MERINHWPLALLLLLPMLIFWAWWIVRAMKQDGEQPLMLSSFLDGFLKFFLWIWHFGGGITLFFLRTKKNKCYLNFSFYHHQRSSRISERKWEIVKSAVSHKRCMHLWYKLGWIRSTRVTKVGCPFWTCLALNRPTKKAVQFKFFFISFPIREKKILECILINNEFEINLK